MSKETTSKQENKESKDIIWIHNSEDYDYPVFDQWYKEIWLEEYEYDVNGVFKGDRYANAKQLCESYLKQWAEAHGYAIESKEVAAERELVLEHFLRKHKVEDITPEAVEQDWQDFANSERIGEASASYREAHWDDELHINLGGGDHYLRGDYYLVVADLGLWNGHKKAVTEWRNYTAESLGQLCTDFCSRFITALDAVSIHADLRDGAIVFDGVHHDGSNNYRLYALVASKMTNADGEIVNLSELLKHKSLEDIIKNATKPLATIPAAVYGRDGVTLDPYFKPKPNYAK